MDPQLKPIIADIDLAISKANKKEQPFAVFDFDNTCSINDIQQALMAYICKHELIRNPLLLGNPELAKHKTEYHQAVFKHYYDMLAHGITFKAYVYALQTLVGYHEDEIPELAKKIIEDQGSELGHETYLDVDITKGIVRREITVKLMNEILARNIKVVVISASPEVLVKGAMQYFSIPTQNCLGTRLETKNGIFVDKLIEPTPIENGKMNCIQKHISHTSKPLVGVGDTMNDFAMISYSTIHVAVDRENELAEQAKKHKWYLIK